MKKPSVDFRREFRDAPVPIRLSCPFSNGIILNYYARALSYNSRVLRVLSVNPFERDIQLIVAAPFFAGVIRCQVASVTRSKRQASTFEVDLRYVDAPVLSGSRAYDAHRPDSPNLAGLPILNAEIAAVAFELAAALESSVGIPFAKAFAQVRDQNPHLKHLALIAATIILTNDKGLANYSVVDRALKRRPQKTMSAPAPLLTQAQDRRAG